MSVKPLPERKWVRLRNFDYSQPFPYSVTICTMARREIFLRPEVSRTVIDSLLQTATRLGFRMIAYCLMPDHLHVLAIAPGTGKSLSAFVGEFKSRTTRLLWGKGLEGQVWQESFYDHVLRKDEDVRGVANYIASNPVRKGLVASAEMYPYSGVFPEEIPR